MDLSLKTIKLWLVDLDAESKGRSVIQRLLDPFPIHGRIRLGGQWLYLCLYICSDHNNFIGERVVISETEPSQLQVRLSTLTM